MNKRVALCLHGKPRCFEKGYYFLNNFMKKHTGIIFDVYLHAWVDSKEMEERLLSLYNPVAYHFESQREFNVEMYKGTIAYNNSKLNEMKEYADYRGVNEKLTTTCWTSLSHWYSRYSCRNLVKSEYDCVVTTRYDFLRDIDLDLNEIDLSMIYSNDIHIPRFLCNDAFLVMPLYIYKNVMNAYEHFITLFNNEEVAEYMSSLNQLMVINTEEILLASILFNRYESFIIQTPLIPNFC
jgi:hypothetical protein